MQVQDVVTYIPLTLAILFAFSVYTLISYFKNRKIPEETNRTIQERMKSLEARIKHLEDKQ